MSRFEVVSIVGVGLLGGSLALALKRSGLARRAIGVGRHEVSLEAACRVGAIDEATLSLSEGIAKADLVVFATPVSRIRELLCAAAPALQPGQLVTDVGSTKSTIVAAAEDVLEGRAQFVGSHPMAGAEKRGVESARADLFKGATCFVTPTKRTDPAALQAICNLWEGIGAHVRLIDPAEHDNLMAQVSHAPHVVAAALVNSLEEAALSAVGPGFLDLTRIASSDPDLWAEICAENAAPIGVALRRLISRLTELAQAVESGSTEPIHTHFARAKKRRDNLEQCAGR